MWKVTEHKCSNQKQEIKVRSIVKEMAEYTYATYAEQLINHFKVLIKEIPRENNFSAEYFYRGTQRNLYSIEIWKLTIEGEFKYKMFTLDFVKEL